MLFSKVNIPIELSFQAQLPHADPFNDVELDVDVTGPDGATWIVPGFWAGDDRFKIRFAGPVEGRYELRSRCSDASDPGLHGQVAELTVRPYDGSNELYRHGRIRVTDDGRRFKHADDTPFLWLADTQWQAFTSRLDWPHGFATLQDDRAAKGFSVVHMVAGPLSGFEADESWHPHQSNEAGWPWEPGWTRINPDFYEAVDLKIAGYVERGLMPCIVGMWGYYMNLMGIDRIRRHWRYLVGRYGALPVVWCLAGEIQMAIYHVGRAGGQAHADALTEQAAGWTEMSHYVRAIDPFHNLVTAHPAAIGNVESLEGHGDDSPPPRRHLSGSARSVLLDDAVLDFDMLQCGHFGFQLLEPTVELVQQGIAQEPVMPLVNGEVNYEGIAGSCWQDQQRFQFWTCILDGGAGYSYGAAGLWVFWNRTTFSKGGDSEYMEDAGGGPWEEVMHLPGSAQVGIGKRILERFPWWGFERIDEPRAIDLGRASSFAAGIPGVVSVYYVPSGLEPESLHGILEGGDRKFFWWRTLLPVKVDPAAAFEASWIDPRTGDTTPIGPVHPAADGFWTPPAKPSLLDWVLVLVNRDRLDAFTA
ncbi:MAG: hypothetical protein QOJ75_17 [Chloroflexota bacterium]|jgi:hypothetical protein|nr:hypothetical protein [Chloroflexota bacterium]